jgi:hypothetical protein
LIVGSISSHLLAVFQKRAPDPDLHRLDDLDAVARHDAALRRRHDIDLAERRPRQRDAEDRDDADADRAAPRNCALPLT